MPPSSPDFSRALLESLVHGPRLIGDLPEAASFHQHELEMPASLPTLDFGQKLGHLFEDALAVLLEDSARFDLLERNLQIRDAARRTVGELDFLLRDLRRGELVHLELATKFYLAVESENQLALPGPDARDNYFRKLERLRNHQLPLARKHRDSLPADDRHEPLVTRQLVFGCLFDHLNAREPATPAFIHPGCRRGRWLTIDECHEHFRSGTRFRIIPKALWPVPLEHMNGIALEDWTPSKTIDRCLMLRIDEDPLPYFITPTGYPHHSTDHSGASPSLS